MKMGCPEGQTERRDPILAFAVGDTKSQSAWAHWLPHCRRPQHWREDTHCGQQPNSGYSRRGMDPFALKLWPGGGTLSPLPQNWAVRELPPHLQALFPRGSSAQRCSEPPPAPPGAALPTRGHRGTPALGSGAQWAPSSGSTWEETRFFHPWGFAMCSLRKHLGAVVKPFPALNII